ncbi:MAG: chemotaxis protein CheA [Candidatus Methanomethylicaceae archaeon]
MKYYKELYLTETSEHIRSLNDLFIHLERNPNDKAAVVEAFRIIHSIKGDSAMMGLKEVVKVAHEAENLLASIKEGNRSVEKSTIEHLLNYVDRIEFIVKGFANGTIKQVSTENVPAVEKSFDTPSEGGKMTLCENTKTLEEKNKGKFNITINNNFEEKLKIIRAFLILKILSENGSIISVDPPYERIASGDVPPKIICKISTQNIQKLKDDLMKVEGIISVESASIDENVPTTLEGSFLAMDKICQIDRLISTVETKSRDSTCASVDVMKDKHRLGEIKVNVKNLDKLFNLAGELVLAKSRLNNIVKSLESSDLKEVHRLIDGLVTDLQSEVMNMRLMPIGQVFGVFSRMVRDMAKELGKEVDLIIEGGDTAIDRKVLEEIIDPVIHIIRNAVDHGIEPPEERLRNGKNAIGTIKIKAYRDASNFIIDIEDDGRGIDPKGVKAMALSKGLINSKRAESMSEEEALYLICVPGFSTKKTPSMTSGRGVGMSAVKSKVEALGGALTIKSSLGAGTKISMRLPASVATIKVLVVRVGDQHYAIPLSDVVEIVQMREDIIKYIQGELFIDLRGKIIKVHALSELLGVRDDSRLRFAVIVRKIDGREYGILVSEVSDEDEVAVKPVPRIFNDMRSLLGASILGDGKPTFIIDIMTLV